MLRYYIKVEGHVQGVGFRYFAYQNANFLGITGFVKNCSDGSVDIEAQGEENNLNIFLEKIKEGNSIIKVENLSSVPLEIKKNEKSFIMLLW